jgi:predicted DNA-binding transcriptional regulator YafY
MMPKARDYDKRIFRLLSILNKLNAGRKVSCRELAGDFNVSLRTVQRDLEILDRTGFLLTSPEKGVWAFTEGFFLRKIKLTAEEASLLGFFGDISSSLGGKFEGAFQNILKKVLQQEYDSPFYAKMPQGMGIGKDAPFIREIEEAVGDNRKILLKYRNGAKVKTYNAQTKEGRPEGGQRRGAVFPAETLFPSAKDQKGEQRRQSDCRDDRLRRHGSPGVNV